MAVGSVCKVEIIFYNPLIPLFNKSKIAIIEKKEEKRRKKEKKYYPVSTFCPETNASPSQQACNPRNQRKQKDLRKIMLTLMMIIIIMIMMVINMIMIIIMMAMTNQWKTSEPHDPHQPPVDAEVVENLHLWKCYNQFVVLFKIIILSTSFFFKSTPNYVNVMWKGSWQKYCTIKCWQTRNPTQM